MGEQPQPPGTYSLDEVWASLATSESAITVPGFAKQVPVRKISLEQWEGITAEPDEDRQNLLIIVAACPLFTVEDVERLRQQDFSKVTALGLAIAEYLAAPEVGAAAATFREVPGVVEPLYRRDDAGDASVGAPPATLAG